MPDAPIPSPRPAGTRHRRLSRQVTPKTSSRVPDSIRPISILSVPESARVALITFACALPAAPP